MKRLARINGNVRVICTGDELTDEQRDTRQYPVLFLGQVEMVGIIIQNGRMFNMKHGETYSHLRDWSFLPEAVPAQTMTLEEYTRQAERLQPGAVLLQEGEYTVGGTINAPASTGCATLTQVFIPALGFGAEYVVKDGGGILYTTDDDGNAKKQSVFQVGPLNI